jgi:hypothetical protein
VLLSHPFVLTYLCMADLDSRRPTNGRQAASDLRELLNRVDIKAGAERSGDRFDEEEAEVSTMVESERSQSPQASLREVFAKARTGIPRVSMSNRASTSTNSSRLPRPRRTSFDSDVSSAPTAMFTPARPRDGERPMLSTDHLSAGDDELMGMPFLSSVACLRSYPAERTPIARAPPQTLAQHPSSAASFHALRARLENASDTHTDASTDLTGWDRSARSLMTTRGQASSSKLNMYLDDDDETNLLDEDLGGVPALTVSHVDDSNMRFPPSVGNISRTPIASRSRPGAIPKGPSLQSASLAERLADIPDDGLDFDDTDREDFDRNRMDDDSDDLLHNENDLLRSSSPGPDEMDSPRRPSIHHALEQNGTRSGRPISGSWENVMEESLLSLPVPPKDASERPASARTPKPTSSPLPTGSGSGSRLLQTIQSEEDSFQKGQLEKSRQSSTENSQDASNVNQSDASTRTSRLSTIGRSRLPLAKPPPKSSADAFHNPQTSTNLPTSERSFPRAPTPTSPPRWGSGVSHTQDSSRPQLSTPDSPTHAPGHSAAFPSPVRPASRLGTSASPARPVSRAGVPVTPSRIPRVSMHSSQPSWDHMDDVYGKSPSRPTPQTPARSQSSLGQTSRLTPARSVSSLGNHGTPPETDVDRERSWGKPLPKLTHANLRMRHDSMESSLGSSAYGGLSPSRPGSVMGMSATGRPTTPSNRSFVGYSVRHGSEVSSSQGSAGSDEDAQARRARKMSLPSSAGMKSGAELRGQHSSLTSPTAASLARSAGLTRRSSLKTPSKIGPAVSHGMRHSASFAGSSVSGLSDRASPLNSPGSRKPVNRVEHGKEADHLRERDWGRPAHSRAPGLSSISPRGTPGSAGRVRVMSGGSMGERPESPIARMRTTVRPRPHTIHFGSTTEANGERRGPLEGGEELLERGEEELEDRENERGMAESREYFGAQGENLALFKVEILSSPTAFSRL